MATTTTEKPELWCGIKIPIIVISGEIKAGKSLFPLLIDPTCRLPKEEAEPRTIVFDQEGSVETYARSRNFKWFDTRAAVFAGVHRKVLSAEPNDPNWLKVLKTKADVNDSPAASMFRAAYLSIRAIEPGKYDIFSLDTTTPFQDGMVDWLRKHPEAFGRTAAQYEKMSSVFLWPDAKAMLSHILAVDCRLRFETVVLTVHMKSKWEGDRKTKERIAEGLDVLDKLCTLHIQLERVADSQGNVPKEPVGILRGQRLLRFGAKPDDDQPILPPRIEKCTPDTIRAWINKPADYNKLKKSERVIVTPPTEIELQQMKLATAEAEAEAANARSTLIDRQKELAAIRMSTQLIVPQTADQSAKTNEAAAEKRKAAAEEAHLATTQKEGERLAATAPPEHRRPDQPATNGRVERFRFLLPVCGIDPAKIKSAMTARGANRFTELSEEDQEGLLIAMRKAADARTDIPF